ncbi:TraU family protein [Acidithiobacillus ferrooxidans]|uniref:Conjugal transfer protein TraU, putative n=1 Tax=Acidithiobacillus ferrooxidans (strain ATCC 23270 / DSM 14882 / CIP 104768 / NCIMB 8455) TaxID=243159 RepID=B7J844_ACIF2|nr:MULTISPECIES: TraU family protein [Acidithiobacillus]ACK78527.1 conjugal transfer protein TraU, putative [Acidithiobacillus ferrooxidans ATCC 23270]MBN6744963.1 TraU family protein [Acidithiobacillus sp. MC2.2]MBN6747959.1 TraU family protein [Acidithiobacillus sp. PG05]
MKLRNKIAGIAAALVLTFAVPALATGAQVATLCPDAGVFNELIGGVCWSALFPLRIAGMTWFGGNSGVPNGASSGFMCECGGSWSHLQLPTVGVQIGYWQPTMLMEAVSHPFCSPVLGGVSLQPDSTVGSQWTGSWGGNVGTGVSTGNKNSTFFNVHLWTFPLITMMQLANIPDCNTGYSGMNLMLMSEVFPTWNDDLLSFLASPEELLYDNPIGLLGATEECAQESLGAQPIDDEYWTAGCWGLLYPMVGSNLGGNDPIQASNIDVARMIAMGFRLGFLERTMGNSTLCGPRRTYVLPKAQYRFQILFPNDETNQEPNASVTAPNVSAQPSGGSMPPANYVTPAASNQGTLPQNGGVNIQAPPTQSGECTHWMGQTPFQWGEWDTQPATGGNYVYLVWQWTNCCLGLIGNQGPTG